MKRENRSAIIQSAIEPSLKKLIEKDMTEQGYEAISEFVRDILHTIYILKLSPIKQDMELEKK